MAIIHYEFPPSANCLKVRVVAAELGIELQSRLVDLRAGESRRPEFLLLNPNGKVPTIDDDGFVLWESAAIMAYLAEKKPERGLYAADVEQRADVNRWLLWNAQHLENATGTLVYERIGRPGFLGQPPDPAEVARGEDLLRRYLGVLDGWLETREHVALGRLTIADIAIAAALSYRGPAQMDVQPFSNVRRWLDRVESLPSWQSSLVML